MGRDGLLAGQDGGVPLPGGPLSLCRLAATSGCGFRPMAPGRCTRRPRLCLAALVSLGCIAYIVQSHVRHQWLNPTQIDKWKQCSDHGDGSSARPEWQWQGPGKPPLWIWYDPGADTKPHVQNMYDGHSANDPCSDKNALIRYSCESWRKQLSRDFELRLVSTANVRSFFKGEDPLPPYFEALPFNHRSDFGSMVLLAEHGGLYLDWDVLVLTPLSQYWSLLRHFEFVGIGGESHPGRGFLEHGLMMARPDNAGLRAGVAEALRMYQTAGGCAGQTCSAAKRLAGEMFMSTLGAFWPKLYEADKLNPCAFLRLPGVHYLPGGSDAISKWNYCKIPSTIKQRFELEIVQHVLTKTLRTVHMTSTKYEKFWFEHELPAEEMHAQCPLLAFMVEYSRGNHSTAYTIAEEIVGDGIVEFDHELAGTNSKHRRPDPTGWWVAPVNKGGDSNGGGDGNVLLHDTQMNDRVGFYP